MVQGRLFTGGSEGTSYLLGGGFINPVLALYRSYIQKHVNGSISLLLDPPTSSVNFHRAAAAAVSRASLRAFAAMLLHKTCSKSSTKSCSRGTGGA